MLIGLYNHFFRSKIVPKASEILRCYIRQRNYPQWTSYFIFQYDCLNDQFGKSHFEFDVDGRNYHILRTGKNKSSLVHFFSIGLNSRLFSFYQISLYTTTKNK